MCNIMWNRDCITLNLIFIVCVLGFLWPLWLTQREAKCTLVNWPSPSKQRYVSCCLYLLFSCVSASQSNTASFMFLIVSWSRSLVHQTSHCSNCAQVGKEFVLTIRDPKSVEGTAISVSYDAFVDDVQVDTLCCCTPQLQPSVPSVCFACCYQIQRVHMQTCAMPSKAHACSLC
jgi:hypothetical protein